MYKAVAEAEGHSLNKWVRLAVEEKLARSRAKNPGLPQGAKRP